MPMEYRALGRSDIKVSGICLGTMTWGQQNTESDGHAQMDRAFEAGVNFFDASEMYPIPPQAETKGRTEEIIGSWFRARKNREKIILATKVAGRSSRLSWLRKDGGLVEQSRSQILEALEASLRRLQTDYIDLYQLHWPDRPMRLFGGRLGYEPMEGESRPIGEILETLALCVKSGKVRHIGLSNETSWGIMSFLHEAEMRDLPRIASVQNAYNFLNRTYELVGSEIAHREGVGLLAYSPLAQGYLTGKYQGGALPAGSRKALFRRLQRYETEGSSDRIDEYLAVAEKHGLDASQMANAFVLGRDFVTSNIIGATSMDQLDLALGSVDIELSAECLAEIEAVHVRQPYPCP